MKISALICTRNRAKSLEMTLRRFYEQRFAGDYSYELIVVDNGSTDQTKDVIERWVALRPETTRRLFEGRRGQNYARNTAIAAASGDCIVFTDDDVLVSEDWLDEIHREFSADPELRILGGRVLLANEQLQRVAYNAHDERRYFKFPHGGGFIMGANMAFRRDFFDRAGLFDSRLGPGGFFAGADEVELVYRGLKAGCRALYAPNALVYHNHDRFTLEQACQLEYGYAKGGAAHIVKHLLRGDGYALRMLYWTLVALPKRWRRRQDESHDVVVRRRWQVKGTLVGLGAAPFVMWGDRRDRSSIPAGDRPPHPQRIYLDRIRQRLDGLSGRARWLDVGCGRHLAPQWMKGHAEIEADLKSRARLLVGVDPDFAALADNRSLVMRINADAASLPFEDGSFDLVTSNMVFEHVEAPLAALKEIRRTLGDGGRLIILTPNWLDIVTIAARFIPNRWHPAIVSRLEERGAEDVYPTHFRFNRPSTIEKLLREAGFGKCSVELLEHPDAYAHAPVIARAEAAWHRLARRWPALRGALLIEAEIAEVN